ncbi:MAG: nicotinate-nucleotide--dimethylbenzimidazole phosphoribosyltransferase [Desulfoplanes sp.]
MSHPALSDIIRDITATDTAMFAKARERSGQLIIPTRALGTLLDIAERMCGIQGTLHPDITSKAVLVMAGDHGVVEEGVSAYPQEVTPQMIGAFLKGIAGVNVLADHVGAAVYVADLGIVADVSDLAEASNGRLVIHKIQQGTNNLAKGPAMTRAQAEQAVMIGFTLASEQYAAGVDILATGDMGIGNTTPSSAIAAVLTGESLDIMVGRGTGVDNPGLQRKKDAVRRGIEINSPDPTDGLDVLSKVGGFEIGGIAGIILAAAYHKKPVVIDGFISTAGALIAQALCPTCMEYAFAGHASAEPGHQAMLVHLGLEPILRLGMRLGEGSGAALAFPIMEGALKAFTRMKTFEEAGVSLG